MRETYKVLASMLALGEFTAKDLEIYSGVNKTTVYSILNRNADLLAPLERGAAKRRGGQVKRYRLKPEKIETVRKTVGDLFEALRPPPQALQEKAGQPNEEAGRKTIEPLISLLAAEESLLYLFPKAKTLADRRSLLTSAKSNLTSGRYEVEMLLAESTDEKTVGAAKALHQRVTALKSLAEAEFAVASGQSSLAGIDRSHLFDQLNKSVQYLVEHEKAVQAEALRKRVLNSLLAEPELPGEEHGPDQTEENEKSAGASAGGAPRAVATAAAVTGPAHPLVPLRVPIQFPPQHQIAVLQSPVDYSGDEYLQQGVTSGITRSIALLPNLTVKVPHHLTLSGQQMSDTRTIQAIGKDLGVRVVLAGLIIPGEDRFRCDFRLVDTEGGQTWHGQYQSSYAGMFQVGEEISKTISKLLDIPLSDERAEMLNRPLTEDSEALRYYMKGRHCWSQGTPSGFSEAIEWYERALEKDLRFSLAYAGQADCYNVLTYYSSKSPRASFTRAKAAAYEALECNEFLAEAYASLACARTRYYWKWAEAESEFRRALEINPSYTVARRWYAEHLTARGRFSEAIDQVKLAQELEPDSPIINGLLGATYFFARQNELAIQQFEDVVKNTSEPSRARFGLGIVYAQCGRYDEAINNLQEATYFFPESTRGLAALGYVFAFGGQKMKAREILEMLLKKAEQQYISSYSLALIDMALGEEETALDHLSGAVEQRDPSLVFLNVDPRFDEIRETQRFQELAKEVVLAESGHSTYQTGLLKSW